MVYESIQTIKRRETGDDHVYTKQVHVSGGQRTIFLSIASLHQTLPLSSKINSPLIPFSDNLSLFLAVIGCSAILLCAVVFGSAPVGAAP